ncbi:MAG: GTP-binding protein [Clostridia bacterium]|nr:GTP-binding protein [Clostridia bacterium]
MTKIDIFSGFLGAGKTTLIKKLIKEAYSGEKLVLIENEFGEIGIDGGFMQDAGIEVTEMNSGCICCSLVGDFGEALTKVLKEYAPDRILIEPSGVGKLSDVIKAVRGIDAEDAVLNGMTTVVDAGKCKMYMKNFGEFFNDQIENATCIVLSHADVAGEAKCEKAISLIREHNNHAAIVATSWDKLSGKDILDAIENTNTLEAELEKMKEEEKCPVCGHHHHEHEHHHDHDEHCCCHDHDHEHEHHHDHDEHCHCHDHDHEHEHHHDHDEHCCCHDHDHEHEHHHDHDEHCCCHDHDHEHEHHHDHDEHCHCHDHDHEHHHHHHHADEVFTSWGKETGKAFTADEIKNALKSLENADEYGTILRAKGIVASTGDEWIHFDYVPGEPDVRFGSASVIGKICVIGSKINEEKIAELFE